MKVADGYVTLLTFDGREIGDREPCEIHVHGTTLSLRGPDNARLTLVNRTSCIAAGFHATDAAGREFLVQTRPVVHPDDTLTIG